MISSWKVGRTWFEMANTATEDHPAAGSMDSKVLSRLHALFTPTSQHQNAEAEPSRPRGSNSEVVNGHGLRSSPGVYPAQTQPIIVYPGEEDKVEDRKGIKVFVTTWNMGDALVRAHIALKNDQAHDTSQKGIYQSYLVTYRRIPRRRPPVTTSQICR